jgi:hypothetical protein
MPGNASRRPNQPASGPAVASVWLGIPSRFLGWPTDSNWTDGPKYRGTNTSVSSRKTCFDSIEDGDMIPSPLGRGLPSRNGYGKSY